MDKKSIKNFAIDSRKKLIEDIKYKASLIGITEDGIDDPIVKSDGIETYSIHGSGNYNIYDEDIIKREKLVHEIENKGFNNLVEEVAYTWFNRIIAIRFMEINNYLPTKTRVLSSETPGKNEPDIITEALDLDLDLSSDDKEKIFNLKDENKLDDLFEFLFIKQCNKLNEVLPGLFEKTEDYAELLLNISFIKSDGIIQQLINSISEEDFYDQVEIIGWIYQYYNTERKDKVLGLRNSLVKKYDIPPATQLFTNDWIVRYMVDNSLGKYWLERNQDSSLNTYLEYYLKNGEKSSTLSESISIEEVKFFDPCMGSGHILVYAFEVFYQIYLELGYSSKQIPELILNNNLYGLDIDDRAYQLAYFAVMMKARSFDRTIFSKHITPNVYPIHESNEISDNLIEIIENYSHELSEKIKYLKKIYQHAKELGSIIQIKTIDLDNLNKEVNGFFENQQNDLYNLDIMESFEKEIYCLINQTKLLTLKYDIVVTNPPYLGKYDKNLKKYINENYKDYSKNLSSVFMFRNFLFCKKDGYSALMTPNAWMYYVSYEKLRKFLINNKNISSLVQLENSAFSEAAVAICFFVMSNNDNNSYGNYIKLTEFDSKMEIQRMKLLDAISNNDVDYKFLVDKNNFKTIPGSPIAYWVDKEVFDVFKRKPLNNFVTVRNGLRSKDNDRFLRYWFEVPYLKIDFNYRINNPINPNFKWFPLNKGGSFRRWWGDHDYVVNFQNDGQELRDFEKACLDSYSFYFKEAIGWSRISDKISFRYYPQGFVFDSTGPSVFPDDDKCFYITLLNSSVTQKLLETLSPKTNYTLGSVSKIPIIKNNNYSNELKLLATKNIELCKNDWDDYETSWNFKTNPLVKDNSGSLKDSYNIWQEHKQDDFNHLKSNEVRLNEIFAEIYSMDVECDVEDKHVSIVRADYEKDIKDLISYAVGCMFGRYSLDEDGLICADDNFNQDNYTTIIPDTDAILPILDTEYFEDDIVEKFIEFIKITFGKEHLEQNLEFIAKALHKSGNTSTDQIRNYFLNDFFKDHVQKYKKRPIYWQFNSGKQKGFRCLIYLHRYDPSTVARIRTDYLHKTQKAIEDNIERCDDIIESNYAKRDDKTKAQKEKNKLIKQLEETRLYDEALAHIANQQIDLDLDDGVKVNYEKFQNIPVETESQKTKKINLLTKI